MPGRIGADVLSRVGCPLAEGPLWDADGGAVLWVDIMAGRVWRHPLGSRSEVFAEHREPIGAIALGDDGTLLGVTPSGLWRLQPSPALLVANPEPRSDLRANDGKPDPVGRFLAGTMGTPEETPGVGALWSYEHGTARALLRGISVSNGLAWSADGSTLYYVDTPTHEITAFDYDLATGDLAEPRPAVTIDPEFGSPDGLAIDSEGGLWVALWGGGAVHHYADGVLAHVIEVPTPYVTCPAFVGDDLDRLVITTASFPLGKSPPPGAGDVYIADPEVAGAPVPPVQRARVAAP